MKKLVYLILMALVLTGCGREEAVFETIGESAYTPVSAPEPACISVWIPDSAAAQTAADGTAAEIYIWDDCEMRIQTMDGGDLDRTLEALTGRSADALTVVSYEKNGLKLHQSVWSASGEEGVQLGRCLVADDGVYHYCVSLVSPEDTDSSDAYAQICASFSLAAADGAK